MPSAPEYMFSPLAGQPKAKCKAVEERPKSKAVAKAKVEAKAKAEPKISAEPQGKYTVKAKCKAKVLASPAARDNTTSEEHNTSRVVLARGIRSKNKFDILDDDDDDDLGSARSSNQGMNSNAGLRKAKEDMQSKASAEVVTRGHQQGVQRARAFRGEMVSKLKAEQVVKTGAASSNAGLLSALCLERVVEHTEIRIGRNDDKDGIQRGDSETCLETQRPTSTNLVDSAGEPHHAVSFGVRHESAKTEDRTHLTLAGSDNDGKCDDGLREELMRREREMQTIGAELRSSEEQLERLTELVSEGQESLSQVRRSARECETRLRQSIRELEVRVTAANARANRFESIVEDSRLEALAAEEQAAEALAARPTTESCLEWLRIASLAAFTDHELTSVENGIHAMAQRVMRERVRRERVAEEIGGCVVCMSAPCEVALFDCGHLAVCHSCAQSLNTCPVCRQPVRDRRRVFTP